MSMTWIYDDNNNRASVERWGSEEKARESLKTLIGCSDCSDCYCCSRCSDCYGCSRCSDSKKDDFAEVPVIKDIHRVLYEAVSKPDALDMESWHTCDTTHCRAGWVVTLAGEAGKELEKQTTTSFAAMQIYKASGHRISPVRFHDSNEDAMADMKRLAEETRTPNTPTGGKDEG